MEMTYVRIPRDILKNLMITFWTSRIVSVGSCQLHACVLCSFVALHSNITSKSLPVTRSKYTLPVCISALCPERRSDHPYPFPSTSPSVMITPTINENDPDPAKCEHDLATKAQLVDIKKSDKATISEWARSHLQQDT